MLLVILIGTFPFCKFWFLFAHNKLDTLGPNRLQEGLQSNNLFFELSLECLLKSGYSDFWLKFNRRRFCFICFAQVRSLSRISPKYLTLVAAGIILFDRKREGTMRCLREKAICEDFSLFILTFRLEYNYSMSLR